MKRKNECCTFHRQTNCWPDRQTNRSVDKLIDVDCKGVDRALGKIEAFYEGFYSNEGWKHSLFECDNRVSNQT